MPKTKRLRPHPNLSTLLQHVRDGGSTGHRRRAGDVVKKEAGKWLGDDGRKKKSEFFLGGGESGGLSLPLSGVHGKAEQLDAWMIRPTSHRIFITIYFSSFLRSPHNNQFLSTGSEYVLSHSGSYPSSCFRSSDFILTVYCGTSNFYYSSSSIRSKLSNWGYSSSSSSFFVYRYPSYPSSSSSKRWDICLHNVLFLYRFSYISELGGYDSYYRLDSLMTSFWDWVREAGFSSVSPMFD